MTVAWFDGATLEVSAAFGYDPKSDLTAASWTDITAYVREAIDIQTGRSAELDTFQAGTVGLVLDNRDRRFDPDYTSSPHYPQVKVNTPIRVRLTYSASTSYLGLGFVSGWTQGWHVSDNDAVCRIVAFDWLKYAARTALPESIWYSDVVLLNPNPWFRMGESTASTKALNEPTGYTGRVPDGDYSGVASLSAGLTYAAGNGSRTVPIRDPWNYSPIIRATTSASDVASVKSVICWVTLPTTASAYDQYLWMQSQYNIGWDNGSGPGESVPIAPLETPLKLWWRIDAVTGKFEVELYNGVANGLYRSVSTVTSLFDGRPHMLGLVWAAASVNFYIDGVSYPGTLVSGSGSSTASTLGTVVDIGIFRGEGAYTMDEVAYWGSTDMSSSMATLYTSGSDGYSGDTVSARLTRVLNATIYTAAPARSFDTSTVTVAGCDFGGGTTKVGDYLQTLATTEGGRIFCDVDGTLTFHNRYHGTSTKTAAFAYTDTTAGTYKFAQADYENDDSRLRGDVSVSTATGSTQRSIDTTVTGDSLGVSTILIDDDRAKAMADGLLNAYKAVRRRIRSLVVTPRSSASALFPAVRTTTIGTRVSFTRTPMGVGSSWTQALTVEGIKHSISVGGGWTTSYLTAPTDVDDTYLIIDDTTYGLINTNRIGY